MLGFLQCLGCLNTWALTMLPLWCTWAFSTLVISSYLYFRVLLFYSCLTSCLPSLRFSSCLASFCLSLPCLALSLSGLSLFFSLMSKLLFLLLLLPSFLLSVHSLSLRTLASSVLCVGAFLSLGPSLIGSTTLYGAYFKPHFGCSSSFQPWRAKASTCILTSRHCLVQAYTKTKPSTQQS